MSVGMLLAIKPAEGLFKRAICQSGNLIVSEMIGPKSSTVKQHRKLLEQQIGTQIGSSFQLAFHL